MGASNRDLEVMAEDEQQFLLRQQQYLQQGAPAGSMGPGGAGGGGGGLMPATVQKAPDRKSIGSPGVQGSPKKVNENSGIYNLDLRWFHMVFSPLFLLPLLPLFPPLSD